jgi:hypothetical protein
MSTRFRDGPAEGKVLQLSRTPMPYFLRVTQKPDGTIDALDQVEDTPEDDEKIFVYRKISDDGTVHVDGRDKDGKRFGRWYTCCTYALHETQPEDAVLRGKDSWPAWCRSEYEKRPLPGEPTMGDAYEGTQEEWDRYIAEWRVCQRGKKS